MGGSATFIPTTAVSNGFICGGVSGAVPFVNHAFEWQNGVVTDLRSLGRPSNCSVATAVNANGVVAGQSEISIVDLVLGIDELRAVVWKNGQIKNPELSEELTASRLLSTTGVKWWEWH